RDPLVTGVQTCALPICGIDAMLGSEELKLLRDYLIERGGSIVFARGKSYSGDRPEIASLEPVVWDAQAIKDVRFELTGEGRMNPDRKSGRVGRAGRWWG